MTDNQQAILEAVRQTKQQLIVKASRQGVCENFGSAEIHKLKDRYGYNALRYGTFDDRCLATEITNLEDWAMSYSV